MALSEDTRTSSSAAAWPSMDPPPGSEIIIMDYDVDDTDSERNQRDAEGELRPGPSSRHQEPAATRAAGPSVRVPSRRPHR